MINNNLKEVKMISAANSGLFNTISANQSKLNTKRNREFLWGGMPRRFSNRNMDLSSKELTGEKRKKFLHRLRSAQAEENQKDWYKLTISVLVTLLILSVVF